MDGQENLLGTNRELYSYITYDDRGNPDCGVVIAFSEDDAKQMLWKAGYDLQVTGVIKLNPLISLHKIASHPPERPDHKSVWKWTEHPENYRWKVGMVRARDETEARVILKSNGLMISRVTELERIPDDAEFNEFGDYVE